ncbi:MAG: replicative DNA helicase [Candidatus Omnitrophica bacterium CG11_big_fil_rev_8_21_14_0_20_45_26]|uniref:Replicative DNA helicase n=1 Tax=Candidatus Abzuiibacterium crystallinum TaxID=1974748 RepID=A0A2H0LUL9_9BACT|nr:MAG: replicative DNA helicase [Candidatus Omnitrophica bacterium CG11_big_fil_rev_8_21_14_0_20_45_26]PIW63414.1 MAG: replicative DNA helicase [Candidatus Omnitrophica bacterium CG12_big_fil_rev_8_21_14_0_65_45_16]
MASDPNLSLVEKIPPQNVDAEVSVLGAMLFEPEVIPLAIEILRSSHFYHDAHKRIFDCLVSLFEKNQPADLVTVTEELRKRKQLEEIGGASYLTQLTANVPTAANFEQHANIVREKGLLRQLIQTATQLVQESYDSGVDVTELLDRAEQRIFQISEQKVAGSFVSLKEIIKNSIETIDQLYQRKEHITGLATGFHDFDTRTAGLQPSDLIIIAGRPSMGKSAFTSAICEHIGITLGKPVAFFSLEMSKEQLVQRMLCSHARVDAQKVRTGYLSHTDWPKLTSAAGKLSEAPIIIDDTPGMSALELRAKARRMKAQYGIELVVIDYLQLMRGAARSENRQQEISEISRSLKALAREIRVPVIAVSQLSRAVEQRTGNRPQLSDLRESGAIEQDADVVVFLYREEYYRPSEENRNKAEAIIAKQRNGPTGSIELLFLKEWTRFENPEFHRGTV